MSQSMGLENLKLYRKSAVRKIADKHLTIFVKRVNKGIDAHGRSFKPYTKTYAEMKARGMNKIRGGKYKQYYGIPTSRQINPPDFRLRGLTLLNLKRMQIRKDSYTLRFSGEAARIVEGNQKRGRDIWTDIPDKEMNYLVNLFEQEIDKEITKLKNVKIVI